MSEIFKETHNSEGVPLLSYKNFKFIKSRCNVGGEIFWRCVNRKCRSYMTTEGQPGKRFIVDSDLNHNHDPNEEHVKPPEPLLSAPSKRKHDEEAEPRKIVATRIEPVFCSTSVPKEKRGIFKSWSLTRRKGEASDSSSSLSTSEDGSKLGIGIPESDPPIPGTYLQIIDPKDHQIEKHAHLENGENDVKELKTELTGTSATHAKFRDEYDVAGWMYGNQLRSLDPQQRFITEKLVADIVFKARLKMLKINSRVE